MSKIEQVTSGLSCDDDYFPMKKEYNYVNYDEVNNDPNSKVKQRTDPVVKIALLTILLLGFTVLYMFVKL
jgi:hypothetical protein